MGGTSANRLVGNDLNGDILGGTGGAQNITLTIAQMPAHNHPRANSTSDDYGAGGLNGYAGGDQSSSTVDLSAASQGGGGSHNNVQPTIILNYIIKT